MQSVFVSHSTADKQFVTGTLEGLVTAVGLACWVHSKNIAPTEKWEVSLSRGLQHADWFFVVVSANAAGSDWVKSETSWAMREFPDRILPILLDDTKLDAVHPDLAQYQYLDFGRTPEKATQDLVKWLVDSTYRSRSLSGVWLAALQPVYYRGPNWHIQQVEATRTLGGYRIATLLEPGKLQWLFDGAFVGDNFLVGPWRSTRPGSKSAGVMTLQIARNGTYLCGHEYEVVADHSHAGSGVMLLARNETDLQLAWEAACKGRRAMQSLDAVVAFPNHGST